MSDLLLCLVLLGVPTLLVLMIIIQCTPRWQKSAISDAQAAKRAQELLESMLPDDERKTLSTHGYLAVDSPFYPGREYRIWPGGGPVEVYEAGKYAMTLCVESVEPLPPADLVLMHKLMIEGSEREYLRVANRLSRSGWMGGHGRRGVLTGW